MVPEGLVARWTVKLKANTTPTPVVGKSPKQKTIKGRTTKNSKKTGEQVELPVTKHLQNSRQPVASGSQSTPSVSLLENTTVTPLSDLRRILKVLANQI
jgi:hypothetical protein